MSIKKFISTLLVTASLNNAKLPPLEAAEPEPNKPSTPYTFEAESLYKESRERIESIDKSLLLKHLFSEEHCNKLKDTTGLSLSTMELVPILAIFAFIVTPKGLVPRLLSRKKTPDSD